MENKGKSARTIFIQKQEIVIRLNVFKTFSNYSSMLANLKIILQLQIKSFESVKTFLSELIQSFL